MNRLIWVFIWKHAQTCTMDSVYIVYMYILCLLEEWCVWCVLDKELHVQCANCVCVPKLCVFTDHSVTCFCTHMLVAWHMDQGLDGFAVSHMLFSMLIHVHTIPTQSICLTHFDSFWQTIVNLRHIHLWSSVCTRCIANCSWICITMKTHYEHVHSNPARQTIFVSTLKVPHLKTYPNVTLTPSALGILHTQKAKLEIPTKRPFAF